MNFDLSEAQELFQTTTERFTHNIDVAARTKIRSHPMGYDRARWTDLCELGLVAVAATQDQGGLEGSHIDLSVIAEAMGTNNALDPWLENGYFPAALLSKTDKNDILETLMDGSKMAAVAFAEPGARYELTPRHTQATKLEDGSGYQISGEKQFIMGGALADLLLITANYQDDFVVFCLPANSDDIETRNYRLADGSIGTAIKLKQVNVANDALINLSFEQFNDVVAEVCLLSCCEIVGLSQLLLNQTLDYVKDRKQFDVPIGSFQVIQHGLVDCYSELEQMRGLLLRALLMDSSNTKQWRANVMGTKSFISDGANLIAEKSVQYHGAMGITDEVAVGHAMKRIILLSRLFGDSTTNLKEYMEYV